MQNQILISAPNQYDIKRTPCITGIKRMKLKQQPLTVRGADVAKQRDMLAYGALTTDADVFLYIDLDIGFSPKDARRVTERARETQGIAGGAYAHPVMTFNFHGAGSHEASDEVHETITIGPSSPQGPVAVDALGTGFLAVHRSVFERIGEQFPELRLRNDNERSHAWFRKALFTSEAGSVELSEDHSFCWRARQAGVPVELLPSVALEHRNRPWYETLSDSPQDGKKTIAFYWQGLGLGGDEVKRAA